LAKQTDQTIVGPTVLGVIRQFESPNAEKDITLIQDENDVHWAIISLTNIQ